jgi:hypothetical protein
MYVFKILLSLNWYSEGKAKQRAAREGTTATMPAEMNDVVEERSGVIVALGEDVYADVDNMVRESSLLVRPGSTVAPVSSEFWS